MVAHLLVRLYNVGLGDCIYLRVPDLQDDVHILIDCGNKFADLQILGDAIDDLKEDLPDAGDGKKRLDLLVVSHPHEDHHKGFEESFFRDLKIGHIWLSPSFDRLNPKASGFHALQDAAQRGLKALSDAAAGDFMEELDNLLALSKDEAIDMLNNLLPAANGIHPTYVTTETSEDTLNLFQDPHIQLKVLNPVSDIDNYYLGGDGLLNLGNEPNALGYSDGFKALFQAAEKGPSAYPRNISTREFEALRSRIQPNALALADVAGHAANNLSVVLLLEWHGQRLLFTGDAEWKKAFKGEVKAGRTNGAWNVMWETQHDSLSQPLDFLKIGHHGSENATPWTPPDKKTKKEHPINKILDTLLPVPQAGERPSARAVASTERTSRWPSIPNPALMAELGRRVANATDQYTEDKTRTHVPDNTLQPQRTDLEQQLTPTVDQPVKCIELTFQAK